MSKLVKLTNNTYLSSESIIHKRGGGNYYLSNLLDNIYPIGSIFISTNTTNPSTYFGGTWERIKGKFLLAADDSTYKIGSTGGEATHKLTINEMPSHTHRVYGYYNMTPQGGNYVAGGVVSTVPQHYGNYPEKTGGDKSHNNMPPYLVVYIWKRIV